MQSGQQPNATSANSGELTTFRCPISLQFFKIPVRLSPCGYTVEAASAEELMRNNQSYPPRTRAITGYEINHTVRQMVEEYLDNNPSKRSEQFVYDENAELTRTIRRKLAAQQAATQTTLTINTPTPLPVIVPPNQEDDTIPLPTILGITARGQTPITVSSLDQQILLRGIFAGGLGTRKVKFVSGLASFGKSMNMAVDFSLYTIDGKRYHIVNLAEQERFHNITDQYYRGAKFLLFFGNNDETINKITYADNLLNQPLQLYSLTYAQENYVDTTTLQLLDRSTPIPLPPTVFTASKQNFPLVAVGLFRVIANRLGADAPVLSVEQNTVTRSPNTSCVIM